MASTRITLASVTNRRRELYTHFCPTCGSTQVRDGRLGNLNRPLFCDQACFGKYRAMTLPNEYLISGVNVGSAYTDNPPRTGDT